MTNKRYKTIDLDEIHYIIDTKGLKTVTDYEREAKEEYNGDDFTKDEIARFAHEDYLDYLYEHSLSGEEVEKRLNTYEHENQLLKESGHEMQVKIETLSKIILRQSTQLKQLNHLYIEEQSVTSAYEEQIDSLLQFKNKTFKLLNKVIKLQNDNNMVIESELIKDIKKELKE